VHELKRGLSGKGFFFRTRKFLELEIKRHVAAVDWLKWIARAQARLDWQRVFLRETKISWTGCGARDQAPRGGG
jgi:hypothetical protein